MVWLIVAGVCWTLAAARRLHRGQDWPHAVSGPPLWLQGAADHLMRAISPLLKVRQPVAA